VSYDFAETLPGSTFDRLTSHDIRIGLRMNLDAFSSSPIYAPGPVSYSSPQPASYSVYAQAPASALRTPPGQQAAAPTHTQQSMQYAQPAPAYAPSTHYAGYR
jgi:hypothetical protein